MQQDGKKEVHINLWTENQYINFRTPTYYNANTEILKNENKNRLIYYDYALTQEDNIIAIDYTTTNEWQISIAIATNIPTYQINILKKGWENAKGQEWDGSLRYPIYTKKTIMPQSTYEYIKKTLTITTSTDTIGKINPDINDYLEKTMALPIWGIEVGTFFGIGIGAILLSLILKFFAGG